MRLAWLASHNDKNSEISLYALISNMQQVYMCNVFGELTGLVNKRIPFLGMNILKISFQYMPALTEQKKHLFVQKSWGTTTSSKQTRSFYARIEIKTLVKIQYGGWTFYDVSARSKKSRLLCRLVILRMLFAYMSPNQLGHMDALESVYCFLLFWTVYCEFYPMFSTALIRLTMYGFGRS